MVSTRVTVRSTGHARTVCEVRVDPRYPEWTDLDSRAPVRQGDVLTSINTTPDPWRSTLIVLTADCDLAKSKHDGALTCVPVLHASDYLLKFRYPRLRRGLSARLAELAIQLHRKAAKEHAAAISVDRMLEWMLEEEHEAIAKALTLEGAAKLSFQQLHAASRALAEDAATIPEASQKLGVAKILLDGGSMDKAVRGLASDLCALTDLPGDAMFLNELSPTHGAGYVAYLRRIIEVNDAHVVRSTFRLPPIANYLRISRLRPPYVYSLSQRFGAVFSAIGLPSDYEDARKDRFELLRSVEVDQT